MDRPRLAVVLSACLLAALLLADAAVASAAVVEHPKWAISEGRTLDGSPSCPDLPMGPACPKENWTYFVLAVEVGQGQRVEVNDAAMQGVPYALYVSEAGPVGLSPVMGASNGIPSSVLVHLPPSQWRANLLRPSLVELRPLRHGLYNGTHRIGTAPAIATATRTGSEAGGGLLFVWANRTAAQAPAETFGRLSFAGLVSTGARVVDPRLAALHPWLAAAEGAAALGLAACVAWFLLSRRAAPGRAFNDGGAQPLTPGEELLALLERSEGYLLGLRNAAVAGLAVYGLAGLLAFGPLVQQVGAVRTLHGATAAAVVGLGFALAYLAVALLWCVQLVRVGRELRRLRALRATAGP